MDFPFTSGAGAKRRPALIVQSDTQGSGPDTIIAAVTTNTSRLLQTNVFIDISTDDGKPSGLLLNSVVECEHLYTVEKTLVVRTIGRLAQRPMAQVNAALKACLELT